MNIRHKFVVKINKIEFRYDEYSEKPCSHFKAKYRKLAVIDSHTDICFNNFYLKRK